MTPFETRLAVLEMAKELVLEQYNREVSEIENQFYSVKEINAYQMQIPPEYPEMPAFPSIQDILDKAKQLNNFID